MSGVTTAQKTREDNRPCVFNSDARLASKGYPVLLKAMLFCSAEKTGREGVDPKHPSRGGLKGELKGGFKGLKGGFKGSKGGSRA